MAKPTRLIEPDTTRREDGGANLKVPLKQSGMAGWMLRMPKAASTPGDDAPVGGSQPSQHASPWARLRGRAGRPAASAAPESLPRQPAAATPAAQPSPEVPAGASAPAE